MQRTGGAMFQKGAPDFREHGIGQGIFLGSREFADLVAADPAFEILSPPSLALVTFALRAGDEATAELLARVNLAGSVFLSHARVSGRYAIRLAVGGTLTSRADVLSAWGVIAAAAGESGARVEGAGVSG